jgi:hypothetical protein
VARKALIDRESVAPQAHPLLVLILIGGILTVMAE